MAKGLLIGNESSGAPSPLGVHGLGSWAKNCTFQCASWGENATEKLKELFSSGVRVHDAARKLDPDKVDWEQHIRSGHWPPHRRCRTCIIAMAQGRANGRTSAPGSYTLGVDVIGPYHKSPDETSLQRRYALVATYLLPVTQEGKPLLTEAHEQGTEEAELEMVELDKEVREWFEELSAGAEDCEEEAKEGASILGPPGADGCRSGL